MALAIATNNAALNAAASASSVNRGMETSMAPYRQASASIQLLTTPPVLPSVRVCQQKFAVQTKRSATR